MSQSKLESCAQRVSFKSIISFVLAAAFLAYEMGVQVSPGVLATKLMASLPLGVAAFGFVMSAYYYSYSAMMIPVGLLYDRYSTKTLLLFAIGLCTAGSIMFALAPSAWWLVFARFFTGLGSAFAFIGVLVVAARCFPIRYYAFLVGLTQLLAAFGAMAGETPIAWLEAHWGWRGTMWWVAAVGAVLLILIFVALRGKCLQQRPQLQIVGANGVKPSLRRSLQVIFSHTQTYWVALYCFCVWAPVTFFASLWGIPYLMTRFQVTNTVASYATDMLWLGIALAAPALGWAVKYVGHRLLLVGSAVCAGLCSLALLYLSDISFNVVLALCFGVGIGAASNILGFDLVQINNPKSEHAAAVGVNNIALVITGVLLQPLVGILLRWHAAGHSAQVVAGHVLYRVSDFLAALWLMPACFVVAALAAGTLMRYPQVERDRSPRT